MCALRDAPCFNPVINALLSLNADSISNCHPPSSIFRLPPGAKPVRIPLQQSLSRTNPMSYGLDVSKAAFGGSSSSTKAKARDTSEVQPSINVDTWGELSSKHGRSPTPPFIQTAVCAVDSTEVFSCFFPLAPAPTLARPTKLRTMERFRPIQFISCHHKRHCFELK